MSTRVRLFDTDMAQVKALVGSGDTDALERAAKLVDDEEEVVEALEAIVLRGEYDGSEWEFQTAASALAELNSGRLHSRFYGDTKLWAYADLVDSLEDARAVELVRCIADGRHLVTGALAPQPENPAGYLTLLEVRELLTLIEGLDNDLIGGELAPFLDELSAAQRDLFSYAD